ncbi:hypothetical protein [Leptospira kirschneri]|uniref:immunity protein Imm33 domain-containing protein n=1 Tax=Leptospira kirschneri TaxID=29507 RepID=UPI00046C7F78|nr:hypothetical protein [Leptospira kirschneri]
MDFIEQQKIICKKLNVNYCPSSLNSKVGIALNVKSGIVLPINGLRHPIEGDTTGWYIWAGEVLSDATDFFQPLHVQHLQEWCPQIIKYLGLPPGWRFLVDGDYEDIWYDESLLVI